MEEIRKAKEKAESYLNWIIEQKWDSFIEKKEEIDKDNYEMLDWPLRFEAYSYLGYKYKSKAREYAIEVRDLWKEWIELNKEERLWKGKVFWPVNPANTYENHISMFRAKDILGIGGFVSSFNEAKDKIINGLLFRLDRIIWQSARSWILRSEAKPIAKAILMTDQDFLFFGITNVGVKWTPKTGHQDFSSHNSNLFKFISITYLLCFFNELRALAKDPASKLIDFQKKNGSFGDSILNTCLCASSIHSTKVDPSNVVCIKTIEYLLSKQKREGCWDINLRSIPSSIGWNAFSTVLVLETIDFINPEIFPMRPKKARLSEISKKPTRVQPMAPFEVPKGISWYDVTIRFLSEEAVHIRAGSSEEGKDFIAMGFVDRRKRIKEREPDWSWKTLREIARRQGEISSEDKELLFRIRENLKFYIYTIRQRLREFFKLSEDPFKFSKKKMSWVTKFTIIDETQE